MQINNRKTNSNWEDNTNTERLHQIACKHVKLGLEHGAKETLSERKKPIVKEIERFREERNELLTHEY